MEKHVTTRLKAWFWAPELQRSTSKLWITTDSRHRLAIYRRNYHKYLITELYRFYALLCLKVTFWLINSCFCKKGWKIAELLKGRCWRIRQLRFCMSWLARWWRRRGPITERSLGTTDQPIGRWRRLLQLRHCWLVLFVERGNHFLLTFGGKKVHSYLKWYCLLTFAFRRVCFWRSTAESRAVWRCTGASPATESGSAPASRESRSPTPAKWPGTFRGWRRVNVPWSTVSRFVLFAAGRFRRTRRVCAVCPGTESTTATETVCSRWSANESESRATTTTPATAFCLTDLGSAALSTWPLSTPGPTRRNGPTSGSWLEWNQACSTAGSNCNFC